MKLTFGARPLESWFDCARWDRTELSVLEEDAKKGVFDRYSVELVGRPGEASDSVFERARRALLAYRIFPALRMRYCVCTPDQQIVPEATIIQRVILGPVRIEMGVRVLEVIDRRTRDERRVGFTYATLKGHAERGIATFYVRQEHPTGSVSFNIESWSRPGNWLASCMRPFARFVQKKFTSEALAHFRSLVTDLPDN